MYLGTVTAVVLAFAGLCSATHFTEPGAFTVWETGSTVEIKLVKGYASTGNVHLVNNGGFLPKNLGYIVKDTEHKGHTVFKFRVWDELPEDKTYQLSFNPGTESGNATNAISPLFTIKKPSETPKDQTLFSSLVEFDNYRQIVWFNGPIVLEKDIGYTRTTIKAKPVCKDNTQSCQ
ncbi:hypothetical protein CLU79DRAFT_845704 [Phycomyces nitens]|nr:hypothetical protein CLU79DRAFT_845704 [Phycomyces nitens]